jgi:hypothetical protein
MKIHIEKRLLFSIAGAVILFWNNGFSQWVANPSVNTAICIRPQDQQDVHLVSDGDGGAIVVWQDQRNDNDTSQSIFDIFVQRIDRYGYNRWTANGVGICTNAADQSAPVITADGNSGAIIAWVDRRNGNRDVYAQRIDSSGNILWTADGIPVAIKPGTQQDLHIVSDGANGAIIIWQDSSVGAWDIYAQHLDGSGNTTWISGGIAICSAPLYQINPKMSEDGYGGALITWQDFRNGNDYNIYAQRINSSGVLLWASGGVGVCLSGGTQSNPKIRAGANATSLIVWQDKRFGIDFDIYAQALDSSGVALWNSNGVTVCNAGGNQSGLDITTENIQGLIVAWKDARSGNDDIYVQRMNNSGVVQWTANGIAIATGAAPQINPNVIGDNFGGAIIVWQDSSAGNWDVKSQRIDANGNIQWQVNGVSVGIAAGSQTSPKNISDGLGGAVFAWQDERNGNFDIYAHHLFTDGTPVGIQEENIFSPVWVFPNPFSQSAIIQWNIKDKNLTVKIFDLTGGVVFEKKQVTGNNFTIEKGNLVSGIYFYELISEENNLSLFKGKIIIAE